MVRWRGGEVEGWFTTSWKYLYAGVVMIMNGEVVMIMNGEVVMIMNGEVVMIMNGEVVMIMNGGCGVKRGIVELFEE